MTQPVPDPAGFGYVHTTDTPAPAAAPAKPALASRLEELRAAGTHPIGIIVELLPEIIAAVDKLAPYV